MCSGYLPLTNRSFLLFSETSRGQLQEEGAVGRRSGGKRKREGLRETRQRSIFEMGNKTGQQIGTFPSEPPILINVLAVHLTRQGKLHRSTLWLPSPYRTEGRKVDYPVFDRVQIQLVCCYIRQFLKSSFFASPLLSPGVFLAFSSVFFFLFSLFSLFFFFLPTFISNGAKWSSRCLFEILFCSCIEGIPVSDPFVHILFLCLEYFVE